MLIYPIDQVIEIAHPRLRFLQIFLPQQFQLSNGMQLIVQPDRRAPTAVHMVWLRVGSMDEVDGTSGVAHVLEHMMFKGSRSVPPGEFSRRVAALGGQENAFTANDFTAYFQQIEKSHLEKVMALEADRMANLQFDAKEFAKEIRVIMEERRWRTDDQPMGLLNEALNAAAAEVTARLGALPAATRRTLVRDSAAHSPRLAAWFARQGYDD